MILKLFSPKNLAKILAFFARSTVTFCKKNYHNIGYFFRQKLSKIAENCDHISDPRLGEISPKGRLFTWIVFRNLQK
jgi:hypothetical protein